MVCAEQPRVGLEPFVVVDVEQSPDRAQQPRLPGPCRRSGQARLATHLRPAVAAGVDVLELEPAVLEGVAEPDVAERAKPWHRSRQCSGSRRGCCRARSSSPPGRGGSCSQRAGTGSRHAPGARRRRASRRAARGGAGRTGTPSGACRRSREPCTRPSPPPSAALAELLEEQGRTVGRAKEKKRVDGRDVDAVVEEVDREDRAHVPVGQVAKRGPALVGRLAAERATAGRPSSVKRAAMNRAWPTLTQ